MSLNLTQNQSLVMTPQLQQAIKLLQLSNLELAEYLENELERNPLLESESGTAAEDEGFQEKEEPSVKETDEPKELDGNSNSDNSNTDTWNENDGNSSAYENWGSSSSGHEDIDFEANLTSQESLRDHLSQQINIDITHPIHRAIAFQLLEQLDPSGYLNTDYAQITERIGINSQDLEHTVTLMQNFDPPGIFARNLKECLIIQLKDKDIWDKAYQVIIEHLEDLAQGKIEYLAKKAGLKPEALMARLKEIKKLQPKPASPFDHDILHPIIPDVILRRANDGSWVVELNNEALPKVLINNSYIEKINLEKLGQDDKKYMHDQLQSANWLVKALHQRATTIMKVAKEIVSHQQDFFTKGVEHLKPMVLKQVAETIGMHESTISRVTTNKYISTARGLYELKYFFSQSISPNEEGEGQATEAIRHRLRKILEKESAEHVYSDDELVDFLKKDGIDIARRTIAKYRKAMHIPSSPERRRIKLLGN